MSAPLYPYMRRFCLADQMYTNEAFMAGIESVFSALRELEANEELLLKLAAELGISRPEGLFDTTRLDFTDGWKRAIHDAEARKSGQEVAA